MGTYVFVFFLRHLSFFLIVNTFFAKITTHIKDVLIDKDTFMRYKDTSLVFFS